MSPQDILFLSLAFGFIVLVGFLSFAVFTFAMTLRTLRGLIENAENITSDVKLIKNQIKSGVGIGLASILTILINLAKKKRG